MTIFDVHLNPTARFGAALSPAAVRQMHAFQRSMIDYPPGGARRAAAKCAAEMLTGWAREGVVEGKAEVYREITRAATTHGLLPMPNIPAMRKTYEWLSAPITAGQETIWYQPAWRMEIDDGYAADEFREWAESLGIDTRDCKTACCFAGKVADDAGVQWRDPHDMIVGDDKLVALLEGRLAEDELDRVRNEGTDVEQFATAYLGLTSGEAAHLFHGENGQWEIRAVLGEVFARAGERL